MSNIGYHTDCAAYSSAQIDAYYGWDNHNEDMVCDIEKAFQAARQTWLLDEARDQLDEDEFSQWQDSTGIQREWFYDWQELEKTHYYCQQKEALDEWFKTYYFD